MWSSLPTPNLRIFRVTSHVAISLFQKLIFVGGMESYIMYASEIVALLASIGIIEHQSRSPAYEKSPLSYS